MPTLPLASDIAEPSTVHGAVNLASALTTPVPSLVTLAQAACGCTTDLLRSTAVPGAAAGPLLPVARTAVVPANA